MPDEEVQERGREGVGMVKAWLEATTWMKFPFNAYEDKARCKVLTMGKPKKFDLRGWHLGDKGLRRNMTVECKRYKTRGGQQKEYRRFLAIAYAHHYRQRELYEEEWHEDFLWVTSNPFETDNWAKLRTEDFMLDCLSDPLHVDVLGKQHVVDQALARRVVEQVWLLVFEEERQMSVVRTPDEVKSVMTVLTREGVGLWQG